MLQASVTGSERTSWEALPRLKLRLSHPVLGLWTPQKHQNLDLKQGHKARLCWVRMNLLCTDGEGVWVLQRTGLLRISEAKLFFFRIFCSLEQKEEVGMKDRQKR